MTRALTRHGYGDTVPAAFTSTALNFENEWTPEEYLRVLYARLPYADQFGGRETILTRIDTVEICFAGKDPNSPAWIEFRDWNAC